MKEDMNSNKSIYIPKNEKKMMKIAPITYKVVSSFYATTLL